MYEIIFTKYTSTHTLSKRYWLENNTINKAPAAQMTTGKAERVTMPFYAFKDALDNAKSTQAFGYGTHSLLFPDSVKIAVKGKENTEKNTISRTKDYFNYPENNAGILMLDHDPSPYGKALTPPELLGILESIHPAIKDAAKIIKGSVSSGVHIEGENTDCLPTKGFHIYIPVLNAADIPRYGETLFKRLWMAGHGFIALASNGAMLVRSPIDAAVFSPERLDFVGKPEITGNGLAYSMPNTEYIDGTMLDTSTIDVGKHPTYPLDLANVEYNNAVTCAKGKMKGKAKDKQDEWINNQVHRMVVNGMEHSKALEQVESTVNSFGGNIDLYGDFVLDIDHSQTITVRELLANRKQYDGNAMPDPIEGKSYGLTTAKFYCNNDKPIIHSLAHGVETKYFLRLSLPKTDLPGDNDTDWPSFEDRPCYKVYDNYIQTNDGTKRPGVYYHSYKLTKAGEILLTDAYICPPLHIDASSSDNDSFNHGLLLRGINRHGKQFKWLMPCDMVGSKGDEIVKVLQCYGLPVDNTPLLMKYFNNARPSTKLECALKTGWHDENNYILPDKVIGNRANIFFQTNHKVIAKYGTKGTLEEWQGNISQYCKNNPILTLSLSAAFAGALLKKAGMDYAGFHFFGDSSTGKSTGQKMACSVWGSDAFGRTWKTTANGLEAAAVLYNDNLLALDELGDSDAREVSNTIYSIGNGTGKQRANVNGTAKATHEWNVVLLSNGEKTLAAHCEEKGISVKAGQDIRLLSIPVFGQHGCFDDLHQFESGRLFSDTMKGNVKKYYGTAGLAYLEKLVNDGRDFNADLESIVNELSFEGATGQDYRAIRAFSLVALAGELATEYGITGWGKGNAIEAAGQCLAEWGKHRGSGNFEDKAIIESVQDYINKYGQIRFTNRHATDTKASTPTGEHAGYFDDREINGNTVYYFFPHSIKDATKGYDLKRVIKALTDAKMLHVPNSMKSSIQARLDGTNKRYYKIAC